MLCDSTHSHVHPSPFLGGVYTTTFPAQMLQWPLSLTLPPAYDCAYDCASSRAFSFVCDRSAIFFHRNGKKTFKELGPWLKDMVIHYVHTWDHDKLIRLWIFMYSTPTNIFEQVFGTFGTFWWHFTSHVIPGRKISACVIFTPLFTEQCIWSHGLKIVAND